MLPEIALTSQFMTRFAERFGCAPVEWHSALSAPERGRVWRRGRYRGGARRRRRPLCAVPAVFRAGPRRRGRGARRRLQAGRSRALPGARHGGRARQPRPLRSCSPRPHPRSRATSTRARGGIGTSCCPGRFSGIELPEVTAIDLRKAPPEKGKWLSPGLVTAVGETLARGGAVAVVPQPPRVCAVDAVPHLRPSHRVPAGRPGSSSTASGGSSAATTAASRCRCRRSAPTAARKARSSPAPGVERVAEEVAALFRRAPRAPLLGLVPGLTEMRAIIRDIDRRDRHHHRHADRGQGALPDLSLVGIVDGDLGLAQGADPRAGERTFQLLHQVTGRAGRAFARGRGLVQTHLPEHPVMQAIISGTARRSSREVEDTPARAAAALRPPRRARRIGARQGAGRASVREVRARAPEAHRIEVLGPAEAPIAVIRGRHRWRLLVKAPRDIDVQAYLRLARRAAAAQGRHSTDRRHRPLQLPVTRRRPHRNC